MPSKSTQLGLDNKMLLRAKKAAQSAGRVPQTKLSGETKYMRQSRKTNSQKSDNSSENKDKAKKFLKKIFTGG